MLVCPDCQTTQDWTADLDRCPRCGSVHLVRRLDEIECRDCGLVRVAADEHDTNVEATADVRPTEQPSAGDPRLAEEVEQALARLFGRALQSVAASAPGGDATSRRTG